MNLQSPPSIPNVVYKWISSTWGLVMAWVSGHTAIMESVLNGFTNVGRALLILGSLILMHRQFWPKNKDGKNDKDKPEPKTYRRFDTRNLSRKEKRRLLRASKTA